MSDENEICKDQGNPEDSYDLGYNEGRAHGKRQGEKEYKDRIISAIKSKIKCLELNAETTKVYVLKHVLEILELYSN
jgi:histidinol phosphatase-like PHP family hydrolase